MTINTSIPAPHTIHANCFWCDVREKAILDVVKERDEAIHALHHHTDCNAAREAKTDSLITQVLSGQKTSWKEECGTCIDITGYAGLVPRWHAVNLHEIVETLAYENYYEDVRKFHLLFHNPPTTPMPLSPEKWEHRIRLILEELSETSTAQALNDFVGFADGLVDLTWVVLGTAIEAGLPFNEIWAEVRRANMAKRGGTLDTSGKLLKPPGWTPPDIEEILRVASTFKGRVIDER